MPAGPVRRLAAAALSTALLWQPGQADPKGDPGSYAFLSRHQGSPARWDPCRTIGYRVNPAFSPPDSVAEVRAAVARVTRATGLTFRYDGPATVVPGRGDYPPGTDLVVAWVVPGTGGAVFPTEGDIAGIGGVSYARAGVIGRAMVLLDATKTLTMARGFGAAPGGTTGRLLLHELGHAVGLQHPPAGDPTQIMHPRLTSEAADWGAGDLAGLRAVGGCGRTVSGFDAAGPRTTR